MWSRLAHWRLPLLIAARFALGCLHRCRQRLTLLKQQRFSANMGQALSRTPVGFLVLWLSRSRGEVSLVATGPWLPLSISGGALFYAHLSTVLPAARRHVGLDPLQPSWHASKMSLFLLWKYRLGTVLESRIGCLLYVVLNRTKRYISLLAEPSACVNFAVLRMLPLPHSRAYLYGRHQLRCGGSPWREGLLLECLVLDHLRATCPAYSLP